MANEAGEPPEEVVAHAPSWMVEAFDMKRLVEKGLVVEEPSVPGNVVMVPGSKEVRFVPDVPPKEKWGLFTVRYTFTEGGSVVVKAPDAGAAERAVRHRGIVSGDLPVSHSGDDAWFEADRVRDRTKVEAPFCEWDPEVDA
jgi:hypothetical protein